jgi:TolB-like protein/DNA-binding winged helix-turn-helix (wHTH) protein
VGEVVSTDFRVGPWLAKPSLNIISGNRTTVHLEPKVMELLVCLARHAGEALPKETLLQAVWPDTFVSEDVLKRCISELRRVFQDDARQPHIIETIPKRGYRLVARVEPVNGNQEISAVSVPETTSSRMQRSMRKWWIAALAIATAVVLAIFLSALRGNRPASASVAPPIHSLAVLPLQNLSADPSQEYFSDGMTDALITNLAQIGSVKVISRTSMMRYKKTDKSLPEIARELNVDGIIEGTVQRSGDRVRITAQLIQGSSDKHLWANTYERDLRDVFTLEREVTRDIADQVQARVNAQGQSSSIQVRPVNLDAFDAYLQGNYHLNKGFAGPRDEELRKAGVLFQRSIDADPQFAPAYIGLAEAHHILWWPSSEDFGIFKNAAERAVELAPDSSEARAEAALTKWEEWDWHGAEDEYRKAITLNPNYAFAHDQLGDDLDAMGRLEEGWKEHELAQELDPGSDHLSWALYSEVNTTVRLRDSGRRSGLGPGTGCCTGFFPKLMRKPAGTMNGYRN